MSFVRTCFVYVLCVTTCSQFRNQFNNNKPLNSLCYCLWAPLFSLQSSGLLKISSTPRLCNPSSVKNMLPTIRLCFSRCYLYTISILCSFVSNMSKHFSMYSSGKNPFVFFTCEKHVYVSACLSLI